MKKIIIILSILLAGLLGYMIATAVNSEKDELYTDSTQQASIDKAVRSLVAEPDLELSLPIYWTRSHQARSHITSFCCRTKTKRTRILWDSS